MQRLLILFVFFFTCIVNSDAQGIAKKVYDAKSESKKKLVLQFSSINNQGQQRVIADNFLNSYEVIQIEESSIEQMHHLKSDFLTIEFFYQEELLVLEMIPAYIYSSTSEIVYEAENGAAFNYYNKDNLHYRGVVQNNEGSICALTVLNNELTIMLSTPNKGHLELSKIPNTQNEYAVFKATDRVSSPTFNCYADELNQNMETQISSQIENNERLGNGCIEIHFFCDNTMYNDFNRDAIALEDFVVTLFNQVSTIYANENIDIKLGPVLTYYTNSDGFSATNSTNALNQFSEAISTNFYGHFAHLLSTDNFNIGGLAWLDQLCGPLPYAYSNIDISFLTFPNYSWTVNVVAHELGHNIGSNHTHWCGWPGGAIDNCETVEDGPCNSGGIPSNGGTIMSYCHLNNVGVNFSNGFGTLPGDLIRSRVNDASCIHSCNTNTRSDLVLSNTSINATTINPGGSVNISYAVKNEGQIESAPTGTAFYISVDTSVGGDLRLDTEIVIGLSVNQIEYYNQDLTISSSVSGGYKYLLYHTDHGYNNIELNEKNNTKYKQVYINAPAPDLVVSQINPTDSNVNIGTNLISEVTITNNESVESEASYLGVYLSTDSTLDANDELLTYK